MSTVDVVVTGMGATTPLGGDVASTWDGLIAGRNGIRLNEAEWVSKFDLPTKLSAPLAVEPSEVLPRVQLRRLDRCEQIAIIAAREAWADAGFVPPTEESQSVDPERLGVAIGTGIGGPVTLLDQDDLLENQGLRKVSPLTVPMLMPNGPAAHVSIELMARAGVHSPASACASGAEGLATGWQMIKSGRADVVVAGGAEACIHQITVAGFAQSRTLSLRNDEPDRASRPFDVDRDGFVLGEGAGVLVLEREDHARARGARIYGTLESILSGRAWRKGDSLATALKDMLGKIAGGSEPLLAVSGASGAHAVTAVEAAALAERGEIAARGFSTLTGHMKEAQFVFAVALAALAVSHRQAFPPFDASEAAFAAEPAKVLATAVGYHHFEGMALVSQG